MKFTVTTLLIILFLTISCDSESIAAGFTSENPPKVNLVILNQNELAEKSVGDSVELQLGFDVSSMTNIKSIRFRVAYNIDANTGETTDYYSASNLMEGTNVVDPSSFQFTPNFFSLSDDSIPSPTGLIYVEEDSSIFIGSLGIPNPEQNGNKWGSGRICVLYLEGIYAESLISLNIVEALEYTNEEIDAEASPHWDNWDVTQAIQVGSVYNPTLKLALEDQTDQEFTILLQIEDAPSLAYFYSYIEYDPLSFSLLSPDNGNFFSLSNYDIQVTPSTEEPGLVSISAVHEDANNTDIPMSIGTGNIIELHFSVIDTISSFVNILRDSLVVGGYNLDMGATYDYNTYFWNIEEELLIDF